MSKRVKIGQAGDFPLKELKNVKVEDKNILVYLSDQGFCAIENRCPHWGVPMTGGKVIEDDKGLQVQCPLHNSRFDLCDGHVTEWVRGAAGMKLPKIMRGAMSLGSKATDIPAYTIEEEDGVLYIMIADEA